jgi:hypothetical protein
MVVQAEIGTADEVNDLAPAVVGKRHGAAREGAPVDRHQSLKMRRIEMAWAWRIKLLVFL